MNNFGIITLALVAGAATFVGVFIGSRRNYGEKAIAFGSAFAAAIMVLISGIELIPAAIKSGGWLESGIFVIIGMGIIALANYIIPHLHTVHDIRNCDQRCLAKASYLIAIGLILHDFPEGFVIPSSFSASSSIGLTVIISSFLHNIPEGYAMTVASGQIKGGFSYKSAAFATLAYLAGAVFGIILINSFAGLSVVFLSIAAGAMLYISFHELLPMAIKEKHKKSLLFGIGTAAIIFLLLNILG